MEETLQSVLLTDIERRDEHQDFTQGVTEKDIAMLMEAKREEEYHIMKGDLVRIDIRGGYVMTNRPEKFRHLERK